MPLADDLVTLLGADRVRADAAELRAHARDCWPRLALAALDAPVVTACATAGRLLGATDLLVLAASRLAR